MCYCLAGCVVKGRCRCYVSVTSLRPYSTAVPACRELAFNILIALCATPALMGVFEGNGALKKLPQQGIGAREFVIINHPHLAQVGGQLADAAGQIFSAHYGGDAVGFKIAAYQMRFGGVSRVVQRFHERILTFNRSVATRRHVNIHTFSRRRWIGY